MNKRQIGLGILIFVLMVAFDAAMAQVETPKKTKCIKGAVWDDKKEPLLNASVTLIRQNAVVAQTLTDFDGLYSLDSLDTGQYYLLFNFAGYDSVIYVRFVPSDTDILQNVQMQRRSRIMYREVITTWCNRRLYDIDNPTKFVLRRYDLQNMPLR